MAAPDAPIDIVVRFSTSDTDLTFTIDRPYATTALSLKQQIRQHLEPPASQSRLRLIYSGKVLNDEAALGKSLNVVFPPPKDDEVKSAKAKGKLPVREHKAPVARVYIHCSVGDELTASEIEREGKDAQAADTELLSDQGVDHGVDTESAPRATTISTTPAPRGFDRLLAAGFTAGEVATLRAQFLAIQAHAHTPDTMPTGAQLMALEERWLGNGSNPNGGGADDGGENNDEDAGGLEDMLYGNLIGFFWPIGGIFWLMREDGVWSRRRQIAVLSGFLINLAFGFLRVAN